MKKRIKEILHSMSAGTYERDEVLALSLLTALAGESIFLLGLPGVGKSMIARRLKLAFKDASVFEYLMSRFSTPDEIFGPVSISKLKNEDRYERVTTGFLPEAEIVFLDEIWKAGPAIQNSLLTVLNEKIYLNGNTELHIPLKGIIAASNELPARDEGLEALWDRFLIRYIVNPIEQKQNFVRLLKSDNSEMLPVECRPITHEEYLSIAVESQKVSVPESVLEIVFRIREKLNDKTVAADVVTGDPDPENMKYYISDRRWKKSIGIMRMSAYLNGRGEVDLSDLMLLSNMLWNDESSIPVVNQIISESVISFLFRGMLDQYKSYKRHAVPKNGNDRSLYSPDQIHYIIQIEDDPLKITINDYNRMKQSPKEVFFGSEITGGTLMLRPRGQFVLRFVKDGVICINNYNYSLRTLSDNQLNIDFIGEAGDSIDSIANRLYAQMNQNIFVSNSNLYRSLQGVVSVYRNRMGEI